MRIPVIFTVFLMLAGCSGAAPKWDGGVSWIGQNREALVAALGEPHETITLPNGGLIIAYEEKEEIDLPAPARLSGSDYQQGGSFTEPSRTVVVTCVREYEADKGGLIVGVKTRQGTGCLD